MGNRSVHIGPYAIRLAADTAQDTNRSTIVSTDFYPLKGSNRIPRSFLEVELEPYPGKEEEGLFVMTMTVPPTARPCSYLNEPKGSIHLEFDHPRIRSLDLQVKIAVAN